MLFDKFFGKRRIKAAAVAEVSDMANIKPYIEDAATILQVEIPAMQYVDILFESNYCNGQYGARKVQGVEVGYKDEIPSDASFLGAWYDDGKHKIILANFYPDRNETTGERFYVKKSPAEHLYTLAHELRHVWQKKFHADEYYQKNAVGMEVINDPAEIDADAFAIAYVFTKKTPFTERDLPTIVSDLRSIGVLDKGQRWRKAMELSTAYGFGAIEKISLAGGSSEKKRLR